MRRRRRRDDDEEDENSPSLLVYRCKITSKTHHLGLFFDSLLLFHFRGTTPDFVSRLVAFEHQNWSLAGRGCGRAGESEVPIKTTERNWTYDDGGLGLLGVGDLGVGGLCVKKNNEQKNFRLVYITIINNTCGLFGDLLWSWGLWGCDLPKTIRERDHV